jgi:hypothetical protein
MHFRRLRFELWQGFLGVKYCVCRNLMHEGRMLLRIITGKGRRHQFKVLSDRGAGVPNN